MGQKRSNGLLSALSVLALVFASTSGHATGGETSGGSTGQKPKALLSAFWTPQDSPPLPPMPEPIVHEAPLGLPGTHPAEILGMPINGGYTLEDLQRIAADFNPTLAQARMAVRAARGQHVQAGLYPNPTIGYLADDMGMAGTSGQQGASISQKLVTGGKLRIGRNVAGHEVNQAQYGYEVQQLRVMNSVRGGYYEVLIAEKMVKINEELVRIASEATDITTRLREAQEVSKAEVLQASIEAERAKLSLFEANNRVKISWRQLAATLGQPEMEPVPLIGDVVGQLPSLTWDESLAMLMSQSPELFQARAGVERARCQVNLQCAERKPDVTVQLGHKFDETLGYALTDATVGVPIRVFDRNQGNIVTAQAELVAAQREVDRIRLQLYNRLAGAYEGYSNALQRVKTFREKILPTAGESLELVRTGYREGEFGYLSLLTAQLTFFNANVEYMSSLQQLWAKTVEMEGFLLTGGLNPVR